MKRLTSFLAAALLALSLALVAVTFAAQPGPQPCPGGPPCDGCPGGPHCPPGPPDLILAPILQQPGPQPCPGGPPCDGCPGGPHCPPGPPDLTAQPVGLQVADALASPAGTCPVALTLLPPAPRGR
jgi:hypothetical protein